MAPSTTDASPEAGLAPARFARSTAAGLTAAFAVLGAFEGFGLGSEARAQVLATTVGLSAGAGALLGLAVATCLPAHLVAWRSAGRRRFSPIGAAETSAEELHRAAGGLLALLAVALPIAIAAGLAGTVAHGFVQVGFAAPFTALGALAGAAAGAVLFLPSRALFARLLATLFRSGRVAGMPLPLVLVGLAGLGLVGALGLIVSRIDLGAWRLGWMVGVAAATMAGLVVGLVPPVARRMGGLVGLVLPVLGLALAGFALNGFAAAEVARRVVPKDAGLSRVVIQVLRKLADRDGDGASAVLAGGDCDDTNPEIGPQAAEIPGNGVDDNCEGGDAKPEPEEVPPEPSPSSAPASGAQDVKVTPTAASGDAKRWNVVLILIDTLRPDHLGLYGYTRPTSPNIDAFAGGALVFENAIAAAPNTPRSMPSIFTGRWPSRIAWVKRYTNYGALKPENESLFELMHGAGYRTEVQSAHWYWDKVPEIKTAVDAWDNRGALSIADSNTQSAAPELTPRVVARLKALAGQGREKPFLLFAHYFEPHGRYMNHPEVAQFGTSLMDKYDSEIAFVDHHLKPVFAALDEAGLKENTLVVVSSDHGESFKEHGFNFHGRTVYQDEIAVPLIVRIPGGPTGRNPTQVSLVDLMPTFAAVAGAPCKGCLGTDLLAIAAGGPAPTRTIFAEALPYPNYDVHMVAAVDPQRQKLVRNVTENTVELFDLTKDAFEATNLQGQDRPAEKPLREALSRFLEGDRGR